MIAEERWVGVEDVATHLGVNKSSVYRWIEKMVCRPIASVSFSIQAFGGR